MTTFLTFALILPWLLIGFGGWLGCQLIRQNGRVLLRLEGLEQAPGSGERLTARNNTTRGRVVWKLDEATQ